MKALASRLLMATAIWWALSEGLHQEWAVPVATVCLAAVASLLLWPAGTFCWRLGGLARFIPYFIHQSVSGGFDVARRAFSPSMRLHPGFMEYPFRLPRGTSRIWFTWIVSLLPGTAGAELRVDSLKVHVLDQRNMPVRETLVELENRVATLFGVKLPQP